MGNPGIKEYEDENRQSLLEIFLFPVRSIKTKRLAAIVSGKTIVITGASYGIGAMLTKILSDFEVRLVLIARTVERLKELQDLLKEKPAEIIIYHTDIRDESQVKSLLGELTAAETGVDIFINNAGKSINRGLVASLDRYDDTRRCSATNYTGPVQLLLGILPGLIARKGHIINVSAHNVLLPPTAGWSAYQSSKTAFDQWLRCMEPELSNRNVMVSSVYLPLVRTRMSMVNPRNHKKIAMSKVKAANAILNCMLYKKRKYRPWWTGVLLFFSNLFPNLWYQLQKKYLKNKN